MRWTLQLDVGSVALTLSTSDLTLVPAIQALGEAFEPGDGPTRVVNLRASMALDGLPLTDLPDAPVFRREGAAGAYIDASAAWNATLGGYVPGARELTAVASGRPLSDDPLVWRAIVHSFARAAASAAAPLADGLLVHGSAARAPGGRGAVLFVGASGAGKTTMMTRLPGWTPLADDTVWVGREEGAWVVRGTPFRGRECNPRRGAGAPLDAIYSLNPAAPLCVTPLSPADALSVLLQRLIWFVSDDVLTGLALDIAADLAREVPTARLDNGLADDITSALASALRDSSREVA